MIYIPALLWTNAHLGRLNFVRLWVEQVRWNQEGPGVRKWPHKRAIIKLQFWVELMAGSTFVFGQAIFVIQLKFQSLDSILFRSMYEWKTCLKLVFVRLQQCLVVLFIWFFCMFHCSLIYSFVWFFPLYLDGNEHSWREKKKPKWHVAWAFSR